MPNHIKAVLSLAVLIVGAVMFYLDSRNPSIAPHIRWVVAGLAILMVGAIWVFPEAGNKRSGNTSAGGEPG